MHSNHSKREWLNAQPFVCNSVIWAEISLVVFLLVLPGITHVATVIRRLERWVVQDGLTHISGGLAGVLAGKPQFPSSWIDWISNIVVGTLQRTSPNGQTLIKPLLVTFHWPNKATC